MSDVRRLGAHGNWRGVLDLLRRTEQDGAAVNHIMYNAALAALARNGRRREAVSILDGMGSALRDDRSFASAIEACRVAREPDEAYAVLCRIGGEKKQGVQPGEEIRAAAAKVVAPTLWCFNTVLAAFAKEGWSRRAQSLVDVDMAKAGVTPNLRTWSSLIDAYRAAGESGRDAVALLERMTQAGVAPDIWCFNHCLNAASGRGEWELAFELLDRMRREGVAPDSWSYSLVMKACAKAEEWLLLPVSFREKAHATTCASDDGTGGVFRRGVPSGCSVGDVVSWF